MKPIERRFVDFYEGKGGEAAIAAGFKGTKGSAAVWACNTLKKPCIKRAIRARTKDEANPLVADRKQRQEFWSKTMLDEMQPMQNRLKASELLGKSEGDFIEKHEHSGKDGGPIMVQVEITVHE